MGQRGRSQDLLPGAIYGSHGVLTKGLTGSESPGNLPKPHSGPVAGLGSNESGSEAALFSPSPAGKSLREPVRPSEKKAGSGQQDKGGPCPRAR